MYIHIGSDNYKELEIESKSLENFIAVRDDNWNTINNVDLSGCEKLRNVVLPITTSERVKLPPKVEIVARADLDINNLDIVRDAIAEDGDITEVVDKICSGNEIRDASSIVDWTDLSDIKEKKI